MTTSDALVIRLADQLKARHWLLASAESCTGGLIAGACTDLSGSSDWFDRGFVTYSNSAKEEMLGVDSQLIARHGELAAAIARRDTVRQRAASRVRRRHGAHDSIRCCILGDIPAGCRHARS